HRCAQRGSASSELNSFSRQLGERVIQMRGFNQISRRKLIHTGLGAAVVAGIVPRILHAGEKAMSATRPTVVGKDQHTYEVIDNWAKLPKGKEFANTHGVCDTGDGRILIHNTWPTGDSVCDLDPKGASRRP